MKKSKSLFNINIKRLLSFFSISGIFFLSIFLVICINLIHGIFVNDYSSISKSYRVEFSSDKYLASKGDKFANYNEFEDLNITELKSEDWTQYTNDSYGYSFEYPENLEVKEIISDNCGGIYCFTLNNGEDITKVELLNISTYFSNSIMDFDYDEGLDGSEYKELRETVINGDTYYYVISNDGIVKMLAYEYKYEDDILWVKTEHRVNGNNGNYYISLIKGINIPEDALDLYDSVLRTMKFY